MTKEDAQNEITVQVDARITQKQNELAQEQILRMGEPRPGFKKTGEKRTLNEREQEKVEQHLDGITRRDLETLKKVDEIATKGNFNDAEKQKTLNDAKEKIGYQDKDAERLKQREAAEKDASKASAKFYQPSKDQSTPEKEKPKDVRELKSITPEFNKAAAPPSGPPSAKFNGPKPPEPPRDKEDR